MAAPSAAASLASAQFDVVLLDSALPESRSTEVVGELLNGAGSPVIVVSSCLVHGQDAVEHIPIGSQHYHVKGEVAESLLLGAIIYCQSRAHAQKDLSSCRRDLVQSTRELERAQLQLIHVEKLEALGQLAAGVAHEVKNPLARILLGVDYLTHADLSRDENLSEILGNITKAAHSANSIIRGMVDISSASELHIESEEINEIVRQSAVMIRHELIVHDINLHFDLADNLPPTSIDAAKIEQVLINLYLNAIHAMEGRPGRQLSVSTTRDVVTSENLRGMQWTESPSTLPQGPVTVIRVEDEGCGIPRDSSDRIFEPFFTTKTAGKGTGLGLTVCAKIIHLHHGWITIENRPEGGAVATVRVPEASLAKG